jgi:hypothetical protein
LTESILGNVLQKIIGVDRDQAKKILDTIPAGISIAIDTSFKEIIHNSKAAEYLRIQPWEKNLKTGPDSFVVIVNSVGHLFTSCGVRVPARHFAPVLSQPGW